MMVNLNTTICPFCVNDTIFKHKDNYYTCSKCGYDFASKPKTIRQMIDNPEMFEQGKAFDDVNVEKLVQVIYNLRR